MWPLFRRLANNKQRCVVFVCPKLKGSSRIGVGVEWVYVILLVERDSVRTLEGHLGLCDR